jgi:ubiquinone/menaquinone biosynthesis C-methylase UbiE
MREIIFNSDNLDKLNNPVRKQWLPPEAIWKSLNLESPAVLVDYGAGTGFFTKELASSAPEAVIHAVDIQPEMIDYLKTHMPENIHPILVDSIQIPIKTGSADALWSIAVYHELGNTEAFLSEAFRVLKPGGVLLIIDWEKENPELNAGPPLAERIESSELIREVIDCGFREITSIQDFNSHICIRALKPL